MDLRIRGIDKVYPDFHLELNFRVRQGELLILLGPSGCGKTTTLRLIAGFIHPDSGTLSMDGRRIDTLPPHRRRIGIVFQDYALFPHLNVRDNIGFGLRMQGWSPGDARQRIEELLRLVSLEGYGKRKVTRLSGGEQQRVALARALAPQPHLLLLDEPLSALDAKLRRNLRTEIGRIQRELGVTTLYVTHDQEEALVLGDRIAVMREGHIEQIDTPERIYNRPANLFVGTFLGQANLLRGRVVRRFRTGDGEMAAVETPVGTLQAHWPGKGVAPAQAQPIAASPRQPAVGREVAVFFRPEHCSLDRQSSNRSHGSNRISGRVVRKEYLGSHQLIEVEAEGARLTLDLAQQQPLPGDGTVTIYVDPGRICLFPAAKS
jgi:ABC-type Fe3+/spermidine/putrescine transport system ATPase subunit